MSKGLDDVMQRIRPEADIALNAIATDRNISKVDAASFLLLAIVTLAPEQLATLISTGRLVNAYLGLGAKIQAPGNLTIEGEPLTIFNSQRAIQALRELQDDGGK